jgi:hypothetical protein
MFSKCSLAKDFVNDNNCCKLILLKTVLLLDVLQLLILSAGTLMSLEIIMFPWNTFYCEQDTVFVLSIYLIVCVQKSILFYFIFLVLLFYVRL